MTSGLDFIYLEEIQPMGLGLTRRLSGVCHQQALLLIYAVHSYGSSERDPAVNQDIAHKTLVGSKMGNG